MPFGQLEGITLLKNWAGEQECLETLGLHFPTWFKAVCGGTLLPAWFVRKEQGLSTLPPLYSSLPPKQVVVKTFAIPKGLSGHSKH